MVLTALRIWVSGRVDLGDDEAYYWAWSQRLDWSYFDHPPAVAWLIAASTAVLGDTPRAVRLPFALLAGLLPLQVAALSPARHARTAGLLTLSAPIFGLMAVFSSPDLPLICAALAVARAEPRGPRSRPAQSVVVGALWGLALLCKLPAVLLGLALLPRAARRGALDVGAIVLAALAVSAPVWIFNLNHDLVMLRFHLVWRHVRPLGPVPGVAAFVGGVAALGLALPLGLVAARGHRGWMWRMGLAWLAVFSVSAVRTRALPHWSAPGLAMLAPAAAARLSGRPRVRIVAITLGLGLTLAVYGQAATGLLPLPPALDPTREMKGWAEIGAALDEERVALGPQAWLLSTRYQTAAQAAWALRGRVPVDRLGGRPDQFDLWRTADGGRGRDAVVFCAEHLPCSAPPGAWAGGCLRRPDRQVQTAAGAELRRVRVWWCRGQIAEVPGIGLVVP